MLAADVEKTGAEIGEPLPLAIFEPPGVASLGLPRPGLGRVVVVGSYTTPSSGDDWLIPGRLTSTNEQTTIRGGYQPFAPAPLITTDDTLTAMGSWDIRVDTHLDVPSDLTPEQLDRAGRALAGPRRARPAHAAAQRSERAARPRARAGLPARRHRPPALGA